MNRLILRFHIDFEKQKNNSLYSEFAIAFANSFCNFQTYVVQEYAIKKMVSNEEANVDDEFSSSDLNINQSTGESRLMSNLKNKKYILELKEEFHQDKPEQQIKS